MAIRYALVIPVNILTKSIVRRIIINPVTLQSSFMLVSSSLLIHESCPFSSSVTSQVPNRMGEAAASVFVPRPHRHISSENQA